jgi:hypothetical protein
MLLMTIETQTLNPLAPFASLLSLGIAADDTAAQPLDLSPKKPSYGYDDEDEDDGYDDEEEDEDDKDEEDEDEEEDENDDYDDEEEDYDDEDDDEDDEDEEDEDEDDDIGYYTRPSGTLCSF